MENRLSPAVRVTGLGRAFADRTAAHRLDLEVNPGEVCGPLGPGERNVLPGTLVALSVLVVGAVAAHLVLIRRTRTGV